MTILKLQPGPADSYDTYIDESLPNNNFSTSIALKLRSTFGFRQQALINFFFTSLPAGSTVTKAEFFVYVSAQSGIKDIHCYKASQVWYLDTVTWNIRPMPGTPAIVEEGNAGQWTKFDVLSIVQDWIANPDSNLGFQLLSCLCDESEIILYSGDYTDDSTKRPYLELTYTYSPPPPVPPTPHASTHVTSGTDPIAVATQSIGGLESATDKLTLDVFSAQGWINITGETWTYLASETISIPGNKTGKYSKGMKIKFTQLAAVKYFYIMGVALVGANTYMTILGGTDYVLTADPISLMYYSFVNKPFGFPDWFNWTPEITSSVGAFILVDGTIRFSIKGRVVHIIISVYIANAGTASGSLLISKYFNTVVTGWQGAGKGKHTSCGIGAENYVTLKAAMINDPGGGSPFSINLYDATTLIGTGSGFIGEITTQIS